MVLAALLAFHDPGAAAPAPDRAHPFLFITTADVERAVRGIQRGGIFAGLAKDLAARAETNRIEDLPPLETAWWQVAKLKLWSDTYPDVFHHTWIVPMKWADLARNCARASLVSPSPSLAAKGRRILLRLSDYTFEFEHFDVGMNYTVWGLAALDAYDILYAGFTPSEQERLDRFFERYLVAVRKSDDYWIEHEPGGRLNNHYAWHKLGLGMIGVFYGRPELVERALRGPKGVVDMLEQGFKDDGLWLEGSIPYQFAETAPLVVLAQALENARHPESLFRYRSPNGHGLKQSYDALVPLLFPDRTLPTIGDCYARRAHIGESPDWEVLYRQFHEPAYAWIIGNRKPRVPQALFTGAIEPPPGVPPTQASRLWPEMGYVALRSNEGTHYWSGGGWSLFATYSGQPVHDHADKLSLMLYADGHLWLPDLEAKTSAEHAFSSATQAQLNRQTLCHNTLLVDGRSQRFPGQRLDLLDFTNTPGLKQATIGDLQGRLYEGVRQVRTLVVTTNYVLDFFQAASGTPREFSWLTHVDGSPATGSIRATNAFALPASVPWSYLRDARSAPANGPWWETFSAGRQTFRMDCLSDGLAEVVQCGFPRDDSSGASVVPMRLVTRRGTNAWFLAVYRLAPTPDEPAGLGIAPAGPGQVEITLHLAGRTYHHRLSRR